MTTRPDFPRTDDGLGHAWGLGGTEPTEVWERLSSAYETQAAELWDAFDELGWSPTIDYAGSEDGEAIFGQDEGGETMIFLHLEDPESARKIEAARSSGQLVGFLKAELT